MWVKIMSLKGQYQFAVDYEERINFDRLRRERLENAKRMLKKHDLDALLTFMPEHNRYLTGEKGMESYWWLSEYTLLPRGGEPYLFQRGVEYWRMKETMPWMEGRLRLVPSGPIEEMGLGRTTFGREFADEIKKILKEHGVEKGKIGIDVMNYPVYKALSDAGLTVVDGMPALIEAKMIKTRDELELHRISCAIADAALWEAKEYIKPGLREYDVSSILISTMRRLGAENYIRGIIASGERTNPYYRIVGGSDRILRLGDVVVIDCVMNYMGYWADITRTFLVGSKASEEQKEIHKEAYDLLYAGIKQVGPGKTTADVAAQWYEPGVFKKWALDVGHGLGITLHNEAPWIHYRSFEAPVEFKPGMVLALETWAGKGRQGVRLEENLIVTETGYEIISKAPFDERLQE